MISFQKQQATHLGFVLDSVSMTVSCPPDKIARLQSMCRNMMKDDIVTVHGAERILGTMESVRSVTPFVCSALQSFPEAAPKSKSFCPAP